MLSVYKLDSFTHITSYFLHSSLLTTAFNHYIQDNWRVSILNCNFIAQCFILVHNPTLPYTKINKMLPFLKVVYKNKLNSVTCSRYELHSPVVGANLFVVNLFWNLVWRFAIFHKLNACDNSSHLGLCTSSLQTSSVGLIDSTI